MLNKRFWWNTIIKQQNEELCMNLQTDTLDNPLITLWIGTGCEIYIELNLNWQFGWVDDTDLQFRANLFMTRTRTRSDGPEPLVTLL